MEVDRNMRMFLREYMSRWIVDDNIDHYDESPIIQFKNGSFIKSLPGIGNVRRTSAINDAYIDMLRAKIYASARCDFDKITNHAKLESVESHRGDSDEEFTKELDAFLGQFKIIKEGDEEI